MKKQTIAIDIDDVLSASAASFIAYSNQKWGTNLTVDDYDEDWIRVWKVDMAEGRRRAHEFHESRIVRDHRHFEEAVVVLRKLSKKYRLVITTSRRTQIQADTLEWIDRYFKGIFDEVRFAGMWDKITHNSIKATKTELCQEIGASYLIDDQLKHCLAAAEVGIKGLVFGNYCWNQTDNLPYGVERVGSWHEVEAYFDGLK